MKSKFKTLEKMYRKLLPQDQERISVILDVVKREIAFTLGKTKTARGKKEGGEKIH